VNHIRIALETPDHYIVQFVRGNIVFVLETIWLEEIDHEIELIMFSLVWGPREEQQRISVR